MPRGGVAALISSTDDRINYQQQVAHQQLQQQSTLPKNHLNHLQSQQQQIYGKLSAATRSHHLSDVVNKVPSVINIPMPIPVQQHTQEPHHQAPQPLKSSMTPSTSLSKMSASKNNLSNDSNDSVESGLSCVSGCHSQNSTLKHTKRREINANEKLISSSNRNSSNSISGVEGGCGHGQHIEKPLPILTTSTNCTNPKEHFLPNDTSLDDDYLSECENCKTAGSGSRYYLDDEELGKQIHK